MQRLHLFLGFLPLALLDFGFFVSVWVQQEDFPKKFPRFRAIIRIEYTQLGITRLLCSPVPNFSVPSQNIDHFMRDITYYWFLGKFCLGTILHSASFCAQQNTLNEISLNLPAIISSLNYQQAVNSGAASNRFANVSLVVDHKLSTHALISSVPAPFRRRASRMSAPFT